MSEEVTTGEDNGSSNSNAYIKVDISESNVRYDTNLASIPEVIFWLKVVESMAMKNILKEENDKTA